MASSDDLRGVLVVKLGDTMARRFTDDILDKLSSQQYTSWQDLTEATLVSWREMGLPLRLFDAIQAAVAPAVAMAVAPPEGDLMSKIEALTAKVEELTSASGRIVSEAALPLLRGSVFIIIEQRSSSGMSETSEASSIDGRACTGVGVCVSAQRAVTAAHNLENLAVGDDVKVYFAETKTKSLLKLEHIEKELDYAVLSTTGQFEQHMPLYTGSPQLLVGKQLALCAFQLALDEELPECSTSSLGVMPASGVKLSRLAHHLVYHSSSWPGDSGGALVMYNGQMVGLHALKEVLGQKTTLKERMSVVEESLASAASSVGSGCVALLAHVFAGHVSV